MLNFSSYLLAETWYKKGSKWSAFDSIFKLQITNTENNESANIKTWYKKISIIGIIPSGKKVKDMNKYHKRGHICSSEACNGGHERILPKPLVISLRTPILFYKEEKWNIRKIEKWKWQRSCKWVKSKAAWQPLSTVDERNTDMIEGGRTDWGYIHECKTLKPWELLIFSFL